MTPPPDRRPPIAVAMEWVTRITTVGFEMVIPGLLGYWADHWIGWRVPVLMLLGFALGMTLGIWHLLRMTKSGSRGNGCRDQDQVQ